MGRTLVEKGARSWVPLAAGAAAACAVALVLAAAVAAGPDAGAAAFAWDPGRWAVAGAGMACAVLATGWGVSVAQRCTNAAVARLLHAAAVLVVLLAAIALSRALAPGGAVGRYTAYLCFVPFVVVPTLVLFSALRMTSLAASPAAGAVRIAFGAVAGLLCVLALSNDAHGLVFSPRGDLAAHLGPSDLGPAFAACVAWVAMTALISVLLFAVVSHGRRRLRIVGPLAVAAAGVAFMGAAFTGALAVPPGCHALVLAVLYALFVEVCLDLGLLPTARRYGRMFRNMPFDLKVLSVGGREVFRTNIARPLDATTSWALVSQAPDGPPGTVASVRVDAMPGTVFKVFRLSAGVGLLAEQADEIDGLQRKLEERRRSLENQNEVLRRSAANQGLLFRQRRERELHERVERDLAATAAQIARILDNRVTGRGEWVREERLQQLNLVKVLVAYSKRKGMLALAAAESDTMDPSQLEVIAREAMADLRSIGIECAVLVAATGPLPMAAVNTVYDSFYDCVIAVLQRVDPVIMTFIRSDGSGGLEMRATIECAIGLTGESAVEEIPALATSTDSWRAVQMGIAHELDGRLSVRDSAYEIGLDEGLVTVAVHAAAEGGGAL